jgi:hypothetical protein
VDFAKYAAMLIFKAQEQSKREKERARTRAGVIKQILLLPITGGISLVRYLLAQLKGG